MVDPDTTGTYENITPLAAEVGTNLCKEIWIYSNSAHGCVKLSGTLTRLFKTTDPKNAAGSAAADKQDLDLDYLTYKTGAVFGEGTTFYTFTQMDVNYDTFNAVQLGAFNSLYSIASVSAIALALLF